MSIAIRRESKEGEEERVERRDAIEEKGREVERER